jgi:PAS domain-containing protein/anti-sigma regulatory factor (Ser/Thr protein kinase)
MDGSSGRPRGPAGRWHGLRARFGARSVAGQVLLLQILVSFLLVVAAVVALTVQAEQDSEQDAVNRSLAVAQTFAQAPGTVEALRSDHPTRALQPRVQPPPRGAGVDFLSVAAPNGVRLADTDPSLIGKRLQNASKARVGQPMSGIFQGAPGNAARAVVPVRGPDGSVVGLVAAGVGIERVGAAVTAQLPMILGGCAGALVLAGASGVLVSRRLRRQTGGIGPTEMTRMYEHHDAVLHAVREGVLILAGDGRLLLANDEAKRLLDLPDHAEGRPVAELGLNARIVEVLSSEHTVTDEVHPAGDRLLSVSTRLTPARAGGRPGIAATLRDTTELRQLAGVAEAARGRLRILYEAGTRIGASLDVAETAQELARVAVPGFADFVTVELLDPVLRGDEPTGAHTAMRRTAVAGVRDDHPFQPVGDPIRFVDPDTPMAAALESGHAVREADLATAPAWRAQDPPGAARALEYGVHSLVTASIQARGVVLGMANFWRLASSGPFEEEDVSFAEELVTRAAVALDNARRYTREHAMSVTLQRSLLPRALPEQDALDVAYRYLPAQAGVGGDWFDVIPLPGARVALVVGDVVGHGLHAAATMGRLRTAVQNFSALDLPPGELLGHLDELVRRIDEEETAAGREEGITGATCLYAVYDPVSGRCVMARAGHFAPALVRPDGSVDFPELPAAPPLGLGQPPFESADVDVLEGSSLALFTDGLVEQRGQDIDTGLDLLGATLARHARRSPEEMCDAVFRALLPPVRRDDIALVVARTRLLDPARVAGWDVPADPAAVAGIRAACGRQLVEWDLPDVGFAAELVVSELLTNAIRYGSEPIHVRLLLGRSLICEVSDGSSTSPHLRRAAATDEGGRGLFLVAQLTDRWGTRYTPGGKVIWTEQVLPVR